MNGIFIGAPLYSADYHDATYHLLPISLPPTIISIKQVLSLTPRSHWNEMLDVQAAILRTGSNTIAVEVCFSFVYILYISFIFQLYFIYILFIIYI